MPIIAVIFISLIGVLGDYLLKLAGSADKTINIKLFILGTLVYASTAIGWFLVMKYIKLGSLGIIYATTTVLALTIIGTVFFKETLNVYEILGLIAGVVSILLLSRFS